jgi:hypothetical protein
MKLFKAGFTININSEFGIFTLKHYHYCGIRYISNIRLRYFFVFQFTFLNWSALYRLWLLKRISAAQITSCSLTKLYRIMNAE